MHLLDTLDPLTYLEINTSELASPEEIAELREKLRGQIGEYIMLKLASDLPVEQQDVLTQQTNKDELFKMLNQYVPNLDTKIDQLLQEFKKEYNQTN